MGSYIVTGTVYDEPTGQVVGLELKHKASSKTGLVELAKVQSLCFANDIDNVVWSSDVKLPVFTVSGMFMRDLPTISAQTKQKGTGIMRYKAVAACPDGADKLASFVVMDARNNKATLTKKMFALLLSVYPGVNCTSAVLRGEWFVKGTGGFALSNLPVVMNGSQSMMNLSGLRAPH